MAKALAARPSIANRPWAESLVDGRQAYDAHTAPVSTSGEVQMGEVMAWLNERLPDDAIITNVFACIYFFS